MTELSFVFKWDHSSIRARFPIAVIYLARKNGCLILASKQECASLAASASCYPMAAIYATARGLFTEHRFIDGSHWVFCVGFDAFAKLNKIGRASCRERV